MFLAKTAPIVSQYIRTRCSNSKSADRRCIKANHLKVGDAFISAFYYIFYFLFCNRFQDFFTYYTLGDEPQDLRTINSGLRTISLISDGVASASR
jgi:hypothetical protein